MTTTVTTSDSQILILVKVGGVQGVSSTAVRTQWQILVDSTSVEVSTYEFHTSGGFALIDISMHALATVSAGTHTIKVQYHLLNPPDTNGRLEYGNQSGQRRLTVIEL